MHKSPNQEKMYRELYPSALGLHKDSDNVGRCKECEHWNSVEGFTPYCTVVVRDEQTAFFTDLEFIKTGPNFGCTHFKRKGEVS